MPTNVVFYAVARATDGVVLCSMDARKPGSTNDAFVKSFERIIQAPDFKSTTPRQRVRLNSPQYYFNFTMDSARRVYLVVTVKLYPERVTWQLVEEMQSQFIDTFGERSLTAEAHSLSKAAMKMFKTLSTKYEDPSNIDALSRVQTQVEVVKRQMQDNVKQMLSNVDRTDELVDQTAELGTVARQFEGSATQARRHYLCARIKMNLLIAFITLAIIGVIVAIVLGST